MYEKAGRNDLFFKMYVELLYFMLEDSQCLL